MSDNYSGITHIENEDGELLWAPNSIDGTYSAQKAAAIVEMLRNLLSEVTLNMRSVSSDSDSGYSMEEVYSKKESDDKYVNKESLKSDVESILNAWIVAGNLPSMSNLNNLIDDLFLSCYGHTSSSQVMTNLQNFTTQVRNVTDSNDNMYTLLSKTLNDLYGKDTDGSTVVFSNPLFITKSDVGDLSSLDSEISGNLVSALNKVLNKCKEQENKIRELEERIQVLESSK